MGATRVEVPTTKAVAIAAPMANFMARRIMDSSLIKRPVSAGTGSINDTTGKLTSRASDSSSSRDGNWPLHPAHARRAQAIDLRRGYGLTERASARDVYHAAAVSRIGAPSITTIVCS